MGSRSLARLQRVRNRVKDGYDLIPEQCDSHDSHNGDQNDDESILGKSLTFFSLEEGRRI